MKFINIIKKATFITLIYLVGIISAQATTTVESCECVETQNIWFRLTTENGIQSLLELNMNIGKSWSDREYIYILVKDVATEEGVVVVFPNGGDWVSETQQDPFLDALEDECKSLEEYLKSKGSTQIKK